MEIQNHNIDELESLDGNPRTISDSALDRLKSSMIRYGLFKPLLVWVDPQGAKKVIAGNQRLHVLKKMKEMGGLPETVVLDSGHEVEISDLAPCIPFMGTEMEARAVSLRDNNADGGWDWDILPGFVDGLVQMAATTDEDWAALTGFDDAMLADLAELATNEHVGLDEFVGETPEAVEPAEEGNVDRKQMKFTFGKVRGMMPLDLYDKFIGVFTGYAEAMGTKEIKQVLDAILDASQPESPDE